MKPKILIAALRLAEKHGFAKITREMIAEDVGVAHATVTWHWGTMPELQAAVLSCAIDNKNLTIIAQGIVENHRLVKRIDPMLRKQALASLA